MNRKDCNYCVLRNYPKEIIVTEKIEEKVDANQDNFYMWTQHFLVNFPHELLMSVTHVNAVISSMIVS